ALRHARFADAHGAARRAARRGRAAAHDHAARHARRRRGPLARRPRGDDDHRPARAGRRRARAAVPAPARSGASAGASRVLRHARGSDRVPRSAGARGGARAPGRMKGAAMTTTSRLELPAIGLGTWLRGRAGSRATARSGQRERLVLVGNGMVGHRLCARLVELGALDRYEVVIYGDEATPAYDRVHLTDVLKGRNPHELLLSRAEWYAEHGIELRLAERVTAVFTGERRILTESGRTDRHDQPVPATG